MERVLVHGGGDLFCCVFERRQVALLREAFTMSVLSNKLLGGKMTLIPVLNRNFLSSVGWSFLRRLEP